MSARRFAMLMWLGVTFAAPSGAGAQALDPSSLSVAQREELGELFTRARKAYEAQNFLESVGFLERAYAIFPEPNILYRIGDAHESAGDLPAAVEHYRRYLAEAPEATDRGIVSRRISDLERRIENSKPEVEEVLPTVLMLDSKPLGASIELDGAAVGLRTPTRLDVGPGTHLLVLRADGFEPLERELRIERGETLSLVYNLDPVAVPAEAQPSRGPWIVGGLGAVSLAAGGTLMLVSSSAAGQLDEWDAQRDAAHEQGNPVPQRPDAYDATASRRVLTRNAGFVVLGVGAIALGTGFVWFLNDERDANVAIGPAGAAIRVTF